MSVTSDEISTFSNVSTLTKMSNSQSTIASHHKEQLRIISNDKCLDECDTIHSNNNNTKSDSCDESCDKTCVSNTNTILSDFICNKPIPYKIFIDAAVICEEFNNIELKCEDHIVNLDEIDVTMDMFQLMFYPYKENYGLNRDFFTSNPQFLPFISFFPEFRSVKGYKFYLLEQIISNIETDLNMSRHCFTKDTLVELTNEITNIKTLLDIKCCSVLSSVTWQNIIDIIRNYKYIHKEVIPILIINIYFKTPTQGVKDTIVRFHYKICNYDIK
jgi:hypothetical protein